MYLPSKHDDLAIVIFSFQGVKTFQTFLEPKQPPILNGWKWISKHFSMVMIWFLTPQV